MNQDIVIVSSWRRADYLQRCLSALRNARGIEDKEVWVFQNNRRDIGIDLRPIHQVIGRASYEFPHFRTVLQNFSSAMLSHCAAWQEVYKTEAPYGYFLVDDAIVTPDFFEWHEAVQADGDWFGSSAWRPDQGNTKPFDLAAYYQISYPNEIAVGLCLKRDSIRIALQSAPDWYPVDRMANEDWKVVMPYVPRVYHIGTMSSHIGSDVNYGSAIDILPNPIPDYGRQAVEFKS